MTELEIKTSKKEEFVDITEKIKELLKKNGCKNGICIVFVPHTTAGITINENADPHVVRDILFGLGRIVPDKGFLHAEGNSPAHIKASLMGFSISVLLRESNMVIGTWQGIYFCEFDGPRRRKVVVQFQNEK